jgi:SpoIID/LytB domain protein
MRFGKTGLFFATLVASLCLFYTNAAAESIPFSYNNGEFKKAIREYKKLADSGKLDAYLNLAIILKDLGYHSRGIGVLREAFFRFGEDLRILSLLARLYYLDNQLDEAIVILKEVAMVKPDDLDNNITLGLCYEAKGQDEEAQKYLEKAIALDKNNIIAHLSLADLYYRKNRLPESAQEYKKISIIDASIQTIYKYWAQVLFKIGNFKDAFRVYEKISVMEPENKFVKERLDEIHLKLGREFFEKEKAKRVAEKAKKMVFVKPVEPASNMVFLKVGLAQTDAPADLKCSTDFQIRTKDGGILLAQCLAGQSLMASKSADDKLILLQKGKDNLIVDEPIIIKPLSTKGTITLFNLRVGKDNFWASQQDRSYRGEMEISANTRGVNIVNKVNLEEYLYSVVPSEMPSNWPFEALKAQAVAARSEALAKLGRHKDEGFDFCSEVHCQVYGGVENETEVANQAVEQTRGIIMSYNGKPVDGVYSSSCGGHTQDNIFGEAKVVQYLKGIPDMVDDKGINFPLSPLELEYWFKEPVKGILCDIPEYSKSTNFRWVRIYTADEMKEMVSKQATLGDINKIIVVRRQKSGHISAIKIIGTKSSCVIEKELNIRKALGNLRSSMFKIEIKYGADKKPRQFIFYGGGWGHGIGMCQAGACGLAQRGKNYKEILKHYFSGVELKKIY